MTRQMTRQIALMTLFSTCLIVVLLALASGMRLNLDAVLGQALPLAVICAAAVTVLLINPFEPNS